MAVNLQIEAYTKTGFKVVIQQSVRNDSEARQFIGSIGKYGVLPERPEKPDETEFCKISAVALTTKEDGTLHMAYYHVNEKLDSRYTHQYFDSPHDRAEFEAWSGLRIVDLPVKEDNDHPKRTAATAKKYIVALPEARGLIRVTSYIKKDDGYEPSHGVERYILPSGNTIGNQANGAASSAPAASSNAPVTLDDWNAPDADKESVRAFLVEEGLTEAEALELAILKHWNSFPNATVAIRVIREKLDARGTVSHFAPVQGSGTEGFKNHRQKQAKAADANADSANGPAASKDPVPLDEIPF